MKRRWNLCFKVLNCRNYGTWEKYGMEHGVGQICSLFASVKAIAFRKCPLAFYMPFTTSNVLLIVTH